jgi:hypothetical protein
MEEFWRQNAVCIWCIFGTLWLRAIKNFPPSWEWRLPPRADLQHYPTLRLLAGSTVGDDSCERLLRLEGDLA